MRPIRSAADFDDLLKGAKALAVAAAWHGQGLFDALAEGPKVLHDLPGDLRALRITVPVLKHLGLVQGDDTVIALTPVAARLHAAGELPTAKNLEFLEKLGAMQRLVGEGGPHDPEDVTDGGVRVHDAERSARFLDMLYASSADSAQQVFDWLAPRLPKAPRVLDVGGGHGRYVRSFVDAGGSGALFDFEHVVAYAQTRHGDALAYHAGNFRDADADFGGPYDLILLSNIVHGEPPAENAALIGRLAAALAPGGRIVMKDMFIDAHGAGPEPAVLFGLTMLYYTRKGESPTVSGAKGWLEAAGLGSVELAHFGGWSLLSGRKPA